MTKWWRHQEVSLILIRSFELLSQELFMSKFQYQNSSTKWWCDQCLGLNLLKPISFLGIIPKASQIKFHHIRITKSKVIHVQILVPKWEKTKNWEKHFWVTKQGNQGITNRGRFSGLQIGARGITNIENFRDLKSEQKDYKLGQGDFKLGQILQIGPRRISNQGNDYKSVQSTIMDWLIIYCKM